MPSTGTPTSNPTSIPTTFPTYDCQRMNFGGYSTVTVNSASSSELSYLENATDSILASYEIIDYLYNRPVFESNHNGYVIKYSSL